MKEEMKKMNMQASQSFAPQTKKAVQNIIFLKQTAQGQQVEIDLDEITTEQEASINAVMVKYATSRFCSDKKEVDGVFYALTFTRNETAGKLFNELSEML
jgi:hypothetical protein